MAVTHATATRQAVGDAVVDKLDVGTTNANGRLVFKTSADAEVATLNFSNPAFGATSAGGVATANAITQDSSATGGTVDHAELHDRDNNEILSCSVSTIGGGGDIELSSLSIAASEPVSMSSLTYTAPT